MSRCTTTIKALRYSHSVITTKPFNPLPTLHQTRISLSSSSPAQMGDILLVAFLTKTLSQSGTRNLDADAIPLSESLLLQIINRKSLDCSKKIDFFKWCSFRHNYKHYARTYSHMFRTLCRAGYLEEVASLLKLMKAEGVVVGSNTLKSLLGVFLRAGKFDFALGILDYMEELGANLNPQMYDSIIVALAKKNQVILAVTIFLKLLDASSVADNGNGVHHMLPGSIACNALLAALRNADTKDEFRKVFGTLREKKGFAFDTWGYNICIHAFGCWADLSSSLRLFKEMKENSSGSGSFGPDLCTYNSLIHVMCLVGKVKDALIVYKELEVSGHEPDAFTYRILIQGCCKSYRIDEATKFFTEMQYNGFLPDTLVYSALLDGMFKARKVMEACQLFERMVQHGVRASLMDAESSE